MGIVDALPDGSLSQSTIDELEQHDRINQIEPALSMGRKVLSIVVETDERVVGIHCDHDSTEWHTTVEGDDFDTVLQSHQEWLDNDIDRVLEGR